MKTITFLFGLLFSMTTFAQSDAILGEWYTSDKEAVVTIFMDGETFSGKTTWMKEPNESSGKPKLDKQNPEVKLRSRKRLGLKIMQDFVYAGDNVWEDGRIYKPSNGKTYGGTATLVDENTLELEGYLISIPFISKTSKWTRKTD